MTDKDIIIDQLQKENKQLREWQEANKATGICETCTHKAVLENDELKRQIRELNKLPRKYKQAFDEIKQICEHKLKRSEYILPTVWDKILDIINKAKEK